MSAQLQTADGSAARILPLRRGHLSDVLLIERSAYRFPWTEAIFVDCLNAGYSGWVLLDGRDTLLGYALMSMAVGEAHVLNLCIDPAQQGRGHGRQLMRHLLDHARAEHLTIMLLEVRKSNHAALRLYDSLGFVRVGTRRGYYPAEDGREDALVLAYDID